VTWRPRESESRFVASKLSEKIGENGVWWGVGVGGVASRLASPNAPLTRCSQARYSCCRLRSDALRY
jgi:hypothetical protein